MAILDRYIEDYMLHCFHNMRHDRVPRNCNMEQILMLASKVEYNLAIAPTKVAELFPDIIYDANGAHIAKLLKHKRGLMLRRFKDLPDSDNAFVNALAYKFRQPPIKFNYCRLYSIVNNLSFEDTVNKLTHELDVADDIHYPDLEPDAWPRAMRSDVLNLPDFTYHSAGIEFHITSNYGNDSKIILPVFMFHHSTGGLCFAPSGHMELFNLWRLQRPEYKESTVIMTDSIELAGINQKILDDLGITDITWVSWLDDIDSPLHDWSQLKGRRIYYLLKEHSGLGSSIIYKTALKVKEKLDAVGVKHFKFISYLAQGVNNRVQLTLEKPFPVVYTLDGFNDELNKRENDYVSIIHGRAIFGKSRSPQSRTALIKPFIHSGTVTVIRGKAGVGKTSFALNLAIAAATGKPAFKGWTCHDAGVTVMYLHKEKEAHDSWGEKYNLLFPMFQQREDHNNNYSDSNQCKTDDGIIGRNLIHKQFREQEGVSEYAMKESVLKLVDRQRKSPVKLLILDELFGCDPESYVIHNTLCIELRKRGCAVISVISEPVIDPTFNRNLQRFMNDSSISIRKRSSAEGILTMQINVASPFDGESKFRCSLSRNGSHPNFYKVKSHKPKRADPLKWPREQLIQKVIKLDEDGLNGQEIADKIGISLSMVKKLKGVAGISETREDKRRRKERESNRALKRKPSRIR